MAITLESSDVTIRCRHTQKNALDLTNVNDVMDLNTTKSYTNGTGSGKGQVVWHDQRSLSTTTSENIDLAGSLTGAFGVVTFTKIKAILIEVVTATTGYRLEVGAASSNAVSTIFGDTSDLIKITAGGRILLEAPVDGYAITAATADILKINNPSGGTVEYKIWVMGEGSVA